MWASTIHRLYLLVFPECYNNYSYLFYIVLGAEPSHSVPLDLISQEGLCLAFLPSLYTAERVWVLFFLTLLS